jgi:hypothetical protein
MKIRSTLELDVDPGVLPTDTIKQMWLDFLDRIDMISDPKGQILPRRAYTVNMIKVKRLEVAE